MKYGGTLSEIFNYIDNCLGLRAVRVFGDKPVPQITSFEDMIGDTNYSPIYNTRRIF
jgi:hypothetical protein